MKALLLLTVILSSLVLVHAQTPESNYADTLFQQAQKKAFSDKREEAQQLLHLLLNQHSDYAKGRILLARTYGWDGAYDKARLELQMVLRNTPNDEEALNLLVDIASWSKEFDKGLTEVNNALLHYPTSANLLFKKARLCYLLQLYPEANRTIYALSTLYPMQAEWKILKNNIQEKLLVYEASLCFGVDKFSQRFDPAYYSSAQVSRKNSGGLMTIRANYSNRFSQSGVQPEVEWYPTFSKKSYGYFNYGYSKSALFPNHRVGGELYRKLSSNFEGSLGFRHLDFGSLNQVWIVTSSLSWYQKQYLITLRPSVISDRAMTTHATSLVIRKYFHDERSYMGLAVGVGVMPDERRLQSGVGINPDRSYTLKSRSASFVFYKILSHHFATRLSYELTNRELGFNSNEYIRIDTWQIALYKKF